MGSWAWVRPSISSIASESESNNFHRFQRVDNDAKLNVIPHLSPTQLTTLASASSSSIIFSTNFLFLLIKFSRNHLFHFFLPSLFDHQEGVTKNHVQRLYHRDNCLIMCQLAWKSNFVVMKSMNSTLKFFKSFPYIYEFKKYRKES